MRHTFCIIIIGLVFANCNSQVETKSISTLALKALLDKEKIQLIDVRTPKEINQGYIKTAKFVNYFDANFYEKVTKQIDKTKPVYLYCRSGNRSAKAAKILEKQGYQVINVLGGYNQWKKEN